MLIATASPSFSPSIPSERQCTPAASRPIAILAASLFNSPPTVRAGPLKGTNEKPPLVATTGVGIVKLSLKNALRTVTQAPATQACPAGYDGCAGDPSGYAIGNKYVPKRLKTSATACEFRTLG